MPNLGNTSGPLPEDFGRGAPSSNLGSAEMPRYLTFQSNRATHCIDWELVSLVDELSGDTATREAFHNYALHLPRLINIVSLARPFEPGASSTIPKILTRDDLSTVNMWCGWRLSCFERNVGKMTRLERLLGLDTTGLDLLDSSAFIGRNAGRIEGLVGYMTESARLQWQPPLSELRLATQKLDHALGGCTVVIEPDPRLSPTEARMVHYSSRIRKVGLHPGTITKIARETSEQTAEIMALLEREAALVDPRYSALRLTMGRCAEIAFTIGTLVSLCLDFFRRRRP